MMTDLTPSEISTDSRAVRELPIRQRIGWLLNHAHRHAMAFQSPNLDDPLRKVAGIIEANMKAQRIPDDGFLLLAESPYREVGSDRAPATLRSGFLAGFPTEIIRAEFPYLKAKPHVRSSVMARQSRVLEMMDSHTA